MGTLDVVRDNILAYRDERPRLGKQVMATVATAMLSTLALLLLAFQVDLLFSSGYRAEMSVTLDPEGRYADVQERFDLADGGFGSIDAEAAAALDPAAFGGPLSGTGSAGGRPGSALLDDMVGSNVLSVKAASDRQALIFTLQNSNDKIARALIEAAVRTYVEHRNAAAAGRVLDDRNHGASEASRPSDTSREDDALEEKARTAARLRALSPSSVSFEDLANIDDNTVAVQLLLERVMLIAEISNGGSGVGEQRGIIEEFDRIDRELSSELERLASTYGSADEPSATSDEQSARVDDQIDRIELLANIGPYAVAAEQARVDDHPSLNGRLVALILAVSVTGAVLLRISIHRWRRSADRRQPDTTPLARRRATHVDAEPKRAQRRGPGGSRHMTDVDKTMAMRSG